MPLFNHAAVAAIALACAAGAAHAHATLEQTQATIGKTTKVTLRVPHGCKGEATNEVRIEIPEGLAVAPSVKVSEPWRARGAADEFDNALADAQEEWEKLHPEPTPQEREELEAFMRAEADATYGGTAQSNYQIGADALEEARSLAVAFEHGVGEEAAAYLRFAAGERVVVQTDPGRTSRPRWS